VLVLSRPGTAAAGEDELALAAGPVVSWCLVGGQDLAGYGAGTEAAYGLNDELSVTAGAQLAIHPADAGFPRFSVIHASTGLRYALDVFVLVPYLRADLAAYPVHPRGEGFSDWGAHLGFGVDWLRWPGWALGAEARYHAFFGGDQPGYLALWVKVAWLYSEGLLR